MFLAQTKAGIFSLLALYHSHPRRPDSTIGSSARCRQNVKILRISGTFDENLGRPAGPGFFLACFQQVMKSVPTANPPWEKRTRYRSVAGTDLKVGVFRYQGRRLVVGWNPRRARKDAHDRKKAIERLQAKLKKSKNPRQHLGRSGTHRFLRVEGEARLEIDEEAVQRAARWDGILGVVTNVRGLKVTEVFGKYTGLWEVEESFRITKHDMRIRPVFHWKPRRVRAHLAIAFMAFSCVRHLEYRVRMQQKRLSPRVIHKALTRVQCSIVYDTKTERWYGLPSKPSTEARMLYRLMGLPLNTVPFALEEGNVVPSQKNIPNKSTR